MAYTFGAATGNGLNQPGLLVAPLNINRTTLTTCWCYPTTLTATRLLWGYTTNAGYRLGIDTTTSSLRYTNDNATTDGVYTFPAGLALNTWTFVALLVTTAGTTVIQVNAWTATPETGPVTQTVTVVTAPVGTHASSASSVTIGNHTTTPSLAWQGDIGGFCLITDSLTVGAAPHVFPNAAMGAMTAAELATVEARFVTPLWRGDAGAIVGMGRSRNNDDGINVSGVQVLASMDGHPIAVLPFKSRPTAMTVSGATVSTRITPRSFGNYLDVNPAGAGRTPYLAVV